MRDVWLMGHVYVKTKKKDTKPKRKLICVSLEFVAALGVKGVEMCLLTGSHICEHAPKKSLGHVNCGNDSALQHAATPDKTLQQSATQCVTFTWENDLQNRWVTYMWKWQHTATHDNTLQRMTTHWNTVCCVHTRKRVKNCRVTDFRKRLQTATHENTLQHMAPPCNTMCFLFTQKSD